MSNYDFWEDLGKIFNAVVAYQEKSMEFDKRFIHPWIQLGNVFDRQDHSTEAIYAYQKAIELDPNDAQNWYELGNAYFRNEAYEEAADAYNKAIGLEADSGWAYNNLGFTLVKQGKHMEAISLFQRSIDLLEDDKDKAVAWNRLGNVYRKLNEYESALAAFQKADELDEQNAGFRDQLDDVPDGPLVESNHGVNSSETTDTITSPSQPGLSVSQMKAASVSAQGTDQAPVEASALSAAVRSQHATSDPAQPGSDDESQFAVPAVGSPDEQRPLEEVDEPAVTIIPQNIVETYTDAEIGVEADIENGVEPPATESKMREGAEQPTSQEVERVEETMDTSAQVTGDGVSPVHAAYEEFLKDNGNDLPSWVSEAMEVDVENQSYGASQEPVTKIDPSGEIQIEVDNKDARVWNEMGNVYFNKDAFDDAITAYRKAIELDRQFAWPYSNLALTYVQKGRFVEAIVLYRRSIDLFSSEKDKAVSWNRLGNVYRRMNDFDNAISAYQHADDLDPDNSSLSMQSYFNLLGNYSMESNPIYVG